MQKQVTCLISNDCSGIDVGLSIPVTLLLHFTCTMNRTIFV